MVTMYGDGRWLWWMVNTIFGKSDDEWVWSMVDGDGGWLWWMVCNSHVW